MVKVASITMQRQPGREGIVTEFTPKFDTSKFKVKLVKTIKADKTIADISEAKILVSGGRGVHDKEGFDKLQALADVLGGQVASSRAMVDNGVMPHECQVGQTGKTVRPNLYMACGISGAIQHLADARGHEEPHPGEPGQSHGFDLQGLQQTRREG